MKFLFFSKAVAQAMSCDGSPGGIINLAAIDETGIEIRVSQGKELPTFYEGESLRTAFQLCCI